MQRPCCLSAEGRTAATAVRCGRGGVDVEKATRACRGREKGINGTVMAQALWCRMRGALECRMQHGEQRLAGRGRMRAKGNAEGHSLSLNWQEHSATESTGTPVAYSQKSEWGKEGLQAGGRRRSGKNGGRASKSGGTRLPAAVTLRACYSSRYGLS